MPARKDARLQAARAHTAHGSPEVPARASSAHGLAWRCAACACACAAHGAAWRAPGPAQCAMR
eukprot:5719043-Prymnesium_polylepis.1